MIRNHLAGGEKARTSMELKLSGITLSTISCKYLYFNCTNEVIKTSLQNLLTPI